MIEQKITKLDKNIIKENNDEEEKIDPNINNINVEENLIEKDEAKENDDEIKENEIIVVNVENVNEAQVFENELKSSYRIPKSKSVPVLKVNYDSLNLCNYQVDMGKSDIDWKNTSQKINLQEVTNKSEPALNKPVKYHAENRVNVEKIPTQQIRDKYQYELNMKVYNNIPFEGNKNIENRDYNELIDRPVEMHSEQNQQEHLYKNLEKNKRIISTNVIQKINKLICELKEIEQVLPYCMEADRVELLLDRGLLLCLHINELMNNNFIGIEEFLYMNRQQLGNVNRNLLDENYWMNQKVDRYARTPQRQKIPMERWFMLKDRKFTDNLTKCFKLNRENNFAKTYNWLMGFNGNN